MTTTDTATLTRAETAALLGAAGGILAGVSHFSGNSSLTWLACALLAAGAAAGFSSGWVWGLVPTAPAAAPASLVGMRVGFAGGAYTVIDDSAPSVAAAQRGGGRCSVVAADSAGGVGLLFLELRHGQVVAAATEERDWVAAGAVTV